MSFILGLFRRTTENGPPAPPTKAELAQEWEGLIEWLREEDIPVPEEDAPIGSYLAMERLEASELRELQAHEQRLRQELEHLRGNGACYKMDCLRIVVGLQALCQTQQQKV